MAINEIKDHLSKVIAQIAETGQTVATTDLYWTAEELSDMFGAPIFPS